MERVYSEKQRKVFKERLQKNIGTKIMTATVFSLAEFEREFGWIWNFGVPEEQLTEEELDMRDKWNLVRDNILTNGNMQKKNALLEISNHDVIWHRYQTQFRVNGNLKDEGENYNA